MKSEKIGSIYTYIEPDLDVILIAQHAIRDPATRLQTIELPLALGAAGAIARLKREAVVGDGGGLRSRAHICRECGGRTDEEEERDGLEDVGEMHS